MGTGEWASSFVEIYLAVAAIYLVFGYSLSRCAFTDDLSARVEYRYTDLGKIDAGDADEGGDGEADTAFHTVRAGLSWHFGAL